jgi:hypothetical protein
MPGSCSRLKRATEAAASRAESDELTFVAVESGSRWTVSRRKNSNSLPNIVLIAQQKDEPPTAFAGRVQRRLDQLVDAGRHFSSAVVAVGASVGAEFSSSRCSIANSLIASLAGNRASQLSFQAEPSAPAETRYELMALAGMLLETVGVSLDISVRFDRENGEATQALRVA